MEQEAGDLALAPSVHAVDTAAASEERKKFRRSVGRMDTAFLMLAAIIVLDTLGAVSSYGAQSFTWLIVMIIFFLVPYGLITAELGSTFPEEGGPYVWVKLAFGRAAAAVVSLMYWVDNPIWLAGTLAITAMATFSTFFVNLSLAWEYVFGLIFVWAGIGSVIMALKFGKWVATIGAVVRILLMAFFTLTVVFYAIGHGVHGFGAGAFKPTWLIFLAAAPILIFNLEGFELPSSASEELKNPRRDVPFAVLRSGIATVLFYGVPVLAILLVLRPSQLSNVSGFLDALQTVFVVYGGHTASSGVVLTGAGKILADIAAIGVIFGLLSSAVVWLIGSDRTQAVAGLDGAAPRWMGHFSRRLGTPIAVNLLSGVVSSGVLVLALTLTSGNAAKYFSATLGVVDLHGDDRLCADLPGGDQAPVQVSRRSPSVPDTRRDGRAVDCRDPDHRLGGPHDRRDHLPGHRHLGPQCLAAQRVRGRAPSVHVVAGHTARGDDTSRADLVCPRPSHPAAGRRRSSRQLPRPPGPIGEGKHACSGCSASARNRRIIGIRTRGIVARACRRRRGAACWNGEVFNHVVVFGPRRLSARTHAVFSEGGPNACPGQLIVSLT